jgi:type I restriction enzyme S subunit
LLQKLAIPVPADTEQSKIAEILSAVDQAIEQTEALIAKQQRIKTGLMQDLLTRGIDEHGQLRTEATHAFKDSPLGRIPVEWEVAPIESKLREIIDYRGRTPVKTDAGIPLITAKNVREGYLSVHPQEFIADEGYETWMTRGIPAAGDVMLTTEAPMGNVARVPGYRIALAQRLITLPTIPEELSSDFLFWLLHWSQTLEKLTLLTSGSTVAGIKQSVFRRVLFSFPAISEQLRITKALDVDKSIADANLAQLTKLQSLKKALMQDLLTGHKRVTALLEPTVA